ncbi:MAG TPA: FtsQ-type POTRA domain-containing protein [Acidimicrobiales bacterium]|nr:FtsQ-type POTRA domain-containing protein [Acidimicrobiales bacterium]
MTSDDDVNLNHRSRVTEAEGRRPRPPLGVDPRLRQRWVETRRQEGRRRLRIVVGVLSVGVLGGASWGATRSPLLDVDRVVVEGAARTGAAAVRDASAIRSGQALLDVDPGAAVRRIRTLPWVQRAELRRDWPGTVRIRVTERAPVAVTRANGGGWALVDRSARVLGVVPEAPPGLAVVDGLPEAGAPGTDLGGGATEAIAVLDALPPALAPRVAAVAVGAEGISLRLAPGGEVRLGTADAVEEKLRAALTVLGVVDGHTVATLDVRIPAAPVLTRR